MASGKRQSALIFCISPFKELYIEPIRHYDPDMIYVFKGKKDDELSKVEKEIYDSTDIECDYFRDYTIDTNDYVTILTNLIDIVKSLNSEYGDYRDIFINISSGTHEFAAAAVFVSMLLENVTAFNVDVSDYGVDGKGIREIISKINPEVEQPEIIRLTDNTMPEDEILGFLIVLDNLLKETRYPPHPKIIEELKKGKYWCYDEKRKSGRGRTSLEQKEEMYLKRHYIEKAIKEGLINDSTKKFGITDKGRMYIMMFGERKEFEEKLCCDKMMLKSERHIGIFDEDLTDNYCYNSVDIKEINKKSGKSIELERNGKTYRFRVDME